jgi:hypothetical protein
MSVQLHCLLVYIVRDSSQQLMLMVSLDKIKEEKEGKIISLFITYLENLENYIL